MTFWLTQEPESVPLKIQRADGTIQQVKTVDGKNVRIDKRCLKKEG